ncbi:MAG TPA: hypothetical protein ENO02_01835, partial [Epsilonproteobacteria bacterium]|nr:hypothetical protein [Campylobacterota bacterium]
MSNKSFSLKHIDGFVVLFISFVVTLSILLVYLLKIDQNLKIHKEYRNNIEEIIVLDQQLDNFFLQRYQYLDYDTICKIMDRLEALFDDAISQKIYALHGQELRDLKSLFEKKNRLTEDFKSLNSRMTNAVHYMFDLRKSIKSTGLSDEKKKTADEIFFQVTQLIMDIPIDEEILHSHINSLRPSVTEGCACDHLLKQVNQFLKDFEIMQGYMDENHDIGFHAALRAVLSKLEQQHETDINKQKT